ncbi:Sn1-specific diacylglycerol lipase [Seminavis robusta]|uniref:sn-1-specific diacylglycerol lipase n=1 Tax=Seminavis robusta TaxID=568900 RepID=A0A9N8HUL5_9STRA|nr:Sn1-specific diacylglycerol lipase [Seminavis robusta]|eukprot:Sro1399_g269360.1 Sn1-specific diacylglycerol lipase (1274) ;mRNA; f:17275-21253
MSTTITTSETTLTTDLNYSVYSTENDGQQQSQLLVEGGSPEELILPPPSCWFTDDLAGTTMSSTTCNNNHYQNHHQGPPSELKHELKSQASTSTTAAHVNGNGATNYYLTTSNERHPLTTVVTGLQLETAASTTTTNSSSSNHSSPNSSPPRTTTTPPLESFRIMNPPARVVAAPSPSWKEISSQVLPTAAKELLSSSMRRICYTARLSYSNTRWHRKYSDIGNNTGGYFQPDYASLNLSNNNNSNSQPQQPLPLDLPPFSSLPWVDRQMVREWRTYLPEEAFLNNQKQLQPQIMNDNSNKSSDEDADVDDFNRARTLVPQPIQRPMWQKADICHECLKPFGPTRLRHHCRLCGFSFCHLHSGQVHRLPHLGYDPDVPERVCDPCKRGLLAQNLAERIAWRLARCRDLKTKQLTPYFETGIDTVEEAALRLAAAALATARSVPLGAQAHVAVETVEVLRKHGLNGIYGIMLRQEFLAAADLLRKALGINKTAWPLSVHELSAAIFYALAQHRAMRGINPDREELIHTLISDDESKRSFLATSKGRTDIVVDETDEYNPSIEQLLSLADPANTPDLLETPRKFLNGKLQKDTMTCSSKSSLPFTPVCTPMADHVLNSLIFYAPIALTFIYAAKEVEMQLLAAQQGWKLLYACLNPEEDGTVTDMPASAVFVHEQQKTVCLAIRGTATIHDVVTDVRQMPVSFPEAEQLPGSSHPDGWTNVNQGNGLAVCGMASAAVNLFREHIDVLLHLTQEGYRIRITGHSLGGGVATLLGVLILKELEKTIPPEKLKTLVRVYAYGSPSCVDASLAEFTESFVTTAVLHDDVVPRLTPTSCRGLLKHLLHIRETWVKAHFTDDLFAIGERASLAWAPRWRNGFTLTSTSKLSLKKSSRSIKRYCQKQIQVGTQHLLTVKEKLTGESAAAKVSAFGVEDLPSNEEKKETSSQGELDENPGYQGAADGTTEAEPTFLVEMMGGKDNRTDAVVIDGEEFWQADETHTLIESDEESLATTQMFSDALDEARSYEEMHVNEGPIESVVDDVKKGSPEFIPPTTNGADSADANEDDEGPGAVVLDEIPLPRMFVPGKIVHIYSHRGTYKAAYVPKAFRELRRLSLAGNMLSDHTTTDYYESLLEVRSVRNAVELPPKWTAFDEDVTCSCCASRFTWASTSDSEAQEARDKHNCRSCGTLVCNPCSSKKMPLPSIGVTVPVRVCDRCYNDLGGVLTGTAAMRQSTVIEEQEMPAVKAAASTVGRPERYRQRRSDVVDDLALRMKKALHA